MTTTIGDGHPGETGGEVILYDTSQAQEFVAVVNQGA